MSPHHLRAIALACAVAAAPAAARAGDWQPRDLHRTTASPSDVFGLVASGGGTPDAAFAQRRERWTYANGERRFDVQVAVKNGDYRVTIPLYGAVYEAGRLAGVPWRSDANGVAHATYSDAQGDALDRVPRSLFPFERGECSLAGETEGTSPAWVIVDRPRRDKPHWFYVDRSSGAIVREIVREGSRTVVTTFDRFAATAGVRRPYHWHVSDGNRANDVDVDVEGVAPQPVGDAAVAIPATKRVFAPVATRARGVISLPASFRGGYINLEVGFDGHQRRMVLDTGTASIMVASGLVPSANGGAVLEHATIAKMTVGALGLSNVSVLTFPAGGTSFGGILGLDFFFGHVVHIDYRNERVEVLTPAAAAPVFEDPGNTIVPIDVSEGLPLADASFGPAHGSRFALDTGSPHLYVLESFAREWAAEIAAHWSPASFADGTRTKPVSYVEGPICVSADQAAAFSFGPVRFPQIVVGVEDANCSPDGISIPLDGIVGTDELAHLDLWFDYDNGRLAIRPNGS